MKPAERRRRLVRRGLPLLGAVALAGGLLTGSLRESEEERVAREFTAAWAARDYRAMHALLTPAARGDMGVRELARRYEDARALATAVAVDPGEPVEAGDGARVPVTVRTRAFGTIEAELELPLQDGGVAWRPHLVMPGLAPGATLSRRTEPPPRAAIHARDGRVLAKGPAEAREHPLGEPALHVAGEVGPPTTDDERRALFARGFPDGTPIGRSGLERILERRVAGTPGGTLLAGERVLATGEPRPARPVRTTIDAGVQTAAVQALAGRLGGIAALDARTGEVRALAGIAFSAPQPPGSTFKIVTTTAALEAGLVEPSTPFPVETKAVIDGVDLENANGESCGGTFKNSFAHSCNSVFAPLGVKVGAKRLVEFAERYGFNREPELAGEAPSTLPKASDIRSPLDLGSTAIGQGRVLATPLVLASMAQTVASEGIRRRPAVLPVRGTPAGDRVMGRRVARTLEDLMVAVVESGTGTAASLAPTKVAGKTGTAELEDTTDDEESPEEPQEPAGSDTDAWFTAYTPVRRPRIAVAVLLVRQGAGGDTAAPAAKIVLQAGLKRN